LRLIRFPLLFAALADASVAAMLVRQGEFDVAALMAVWLAAGGMYVFAMAANDVFDAGPDRQAQQAGRFSRINPVASGELAFPVAAAVAFGGAGLAVAAAVASPAVNDWAVVAGLAAVVLYNVGAKRFPPVGLVMLGAVEAAYAGLALTGGEALRWWAVPTILACHVIFIRAFAHAWQRKRPPLYGNNWFILLAACSACLLALGWARQRLGAEFWPAGERLGNVGMMWGVFLIVFGAIFLRAARAQRGPLLVLAGTAWLILLDFAFVQAAGYNRPSMLFLGLLAGMVLATQLMRLSRPLRSGMA